MGGGVCVSSDFCGVLPAKHRGAKNLRPLVCGEMHQRLWKETGRAPAEGWDPSAEFGVGGTPAQDPDPQGTLVPSPPSCRITRRRLRFTGGGLGPGTTSRATGVRPAASFSPKVSPLGLPFF